jgi:hypothetical protein
MQFNEKDTLISPDELSYKLYGSTIYTAVSQGICLSCKEFATSNDSNNSDEVLQQYFDTGLCDSCFKDICQG